MTCHVVFVTLLTDLAIGSFLDQSIVLLRYVCMGGSRVRRRGGTIIIITIQNALKDGVSAHKVCAPGSGGMPPLILFILETQIFGPFY